MSKVEKVNSIKNRERKRKRERENLKERGKVRDRQTETHEERVFHLDSVNSSVKHCFTRGPTL